MICEDEFFIYLMEDSVCCLNGPLMWRLAQSHAGEPSPVGSHRTSTNRLVWNPHPTILQQLFIKRVYNCKELLFFIGVD